MSLDFICKSLLCFAYHISYVSQKLPLCEILTLFATLLNFTCNFDVIVVAFSFMCHVLGFRGTLQVCHVGESFLVLSLQPVWIVGFVRV